MEPTSTLTYVHVKNLTIALGAAHCRCHNDKSVARDKVSDASLLAFGFRSWVRWDIELQR